MNQRVGLCAAVAASVCLVAGLFAYAQNKKGDEEQERKVKESEVPAAARAALKRLAAGAPITEYSEEIEHGHKFYEGSWKGPDGNIDGLVTEAGDVVEIEEKISADKAPAVVRAELQKAAGKDAKVTIEKKTMILYEGHFKKNGKGHEMILTPDGRQYHEEGEKGGEKDKDDDDD